MMSYKFQSKFSYVFDVSNVSKLYIFIGKIISFYGNKFIETEISQ